MIKISYPLYLKDDKSPELLYIKIGADNKTSYHYKDKITPGLHASFYLNKVLDGQFSILTKEEVEKIENLNKPFPRYFICGSLIDWTGYVMFTSFEKGKYFKSKNEIYDSPWALRDALSCWKEVSESEALETIRKYPMYFKAKFAANAYIVAKSKNEIFIVRKDGETVKNTVLTFDDLVALLHEVITQEEAESLVNNKIILKHWSENGTGVTNFPVDKLPLYEKAVKEYGDKNLLVAKESIDGHAGYYSLHHLSGCQALGCQALGGQALSEFWKIFRKIEEENIWPKYIICPDGFLDCAYIKWASEDKAYQILFNGGEKDYSASFVKNMTRSGHWIQTTKEKAEKFLEPKQEFPVYFCSKEEKGFKDTSQFIQFLNTTEYQIIQKDGQINSIVGIQKDNLERVRKSGCWKEIPSEVVESKLKEINLEKSKRETRIKELTQKLQTLSMEQLNNIRFTTNG